MDIADCLRPSYVLRHQDILLKRWCDLASPSALGRATLVAALHVGAAMLLLAPVKMQHAQDELLLVDFVAPASAVRTSEPRPAAPPKSAAAIAMPASVAAPSPSAISEKTAPASPAPAAPSSAAASNTAAPSSGADASAPVSEARFDADYLRNPKPPYPTTSRRRGEEGRVVLKVLVKADGSTGDVQLHKSSGFGLLDESARNTVARWRFAAARRGRDAVESWVLVPLVFSLDDQG